MSRKNKHSGQSAENELSKGSQASNPENKQHKGSEASNTVDWDKLPPLLKVWPEVARILRVNRSRVYELLPSLPGVVKLGERQYRVNRDVLRRWLEGAAI